MRFRYDKDLGVVLPAEGANIFQEETKRSHLAAPMVMRDIQEYRTVASDVASGDKRITISSRSRHRTFLKDNCLVEVGNERLKPRKPIPLSRQKRREDIKRAVELVRQGRQNEV
jgi:hypothetical protein